MTDETSTSHELTRENEQLRQKLNDAMRSLEKYGQLNLDEANQAIEYKKQAEHQKQIDAGEYEKALTKLQAGYEKSMQQLQEFSGQQLLENQLGRAIAARRGDAEMLMPYLQAKGMVKVTNKDGMPVIMANYNGNAVSPDELVACMAKDERFDLYFPSTGQSGTGAQADTTVASKGTHKYAELFKSV